MTPTMLCRTLCCGHGEGSHASRVVARCARGCTPWPPAPAWTSSRPAASGPCRSILAQPATAPCSTAPRRAMSPGWAPTPTPVSPAAWPARRALRAARGRRTRLRRRPAAPAGQLAGGAAPVRGARLLRLQDRHHDGHLDHGGELRPGPRPQDRRREGSLTHPAADAAEDRRRAPARDRHRVRPRAGTRRRRRPGRAAHQRRHLVDAAAAALVPRHRGRHRLRRAGPADPTLALPPNQGERPAGRGLLPLGPRRRCVISTGRSPC
jgi:hypothetical protein